LHVHHSGAPIAAHGRAALRELGDAAIAHQTGCLVGPPGRPRTIGLGCLFRLHHLSPFKSGGSGRRSSPDTPPPINQLSQGGAGAAPPPPTPHRPTKYFRGAVSAFGPHHALTHHNREPREDGARS